MALSPAKKSVRALFNQLAVPYACHALRRRRAENQADVRWIQPQRRERVLDLACGPGTFAIELSRYGGRVVGLDLAEEMIAQARQAARQRRCPPLTFVVGDGEQLPFPDGFFDLVVCSFSLPGFPAPEQVSTEIARVSRPGARVVLLEVAAAEDAEERAWVNQLERERSGAPMRLLSLSELLVLFRTAGFELEDCHIHRRRRHLEEWLALGCPGARSPLRAEIRRRVRAGGESLRVARSGGRWYLYHKVARLLWRKPEPKSFSQSGDRSKWRWHQNRYNTPAGVGRDQDSKGKG